jgi:hypothetical protein
MKTYKLPVLWQMYGYVEVTAESLEDAIDIAENESNLPEGDYIEASFEVDYGAIDEEFLDDED